MLRHWSRALWIVVYTAMIWTGMSIPGWPVTLDSIDPTQNWYVQEITISGNQQFSTEELKDVMLTKERVWYLPWKERPRFDPISFTTDLERVQRFYKARGYYDSTVTYDLALDEPDELIAIHLQVEEGQPVSVADVDVEVAPTTANATSPPVLPAPLPVESGAVFTETAYQTTEQLLREFYLDQGHAHVEVQRKAVVDLATDQVKVQYSVEPGPVAVFGATRVEGTQDVESQLVLRELTYQPGEQFSFEKIAESRQKILALNLFSAVLIAPEQSEQKPRVVPMRVKVEEKPPRSVSLGLKYSTDDEYGVQAQWRHHNWLGGGRQLSLLAEISSVTRLFDVTLIQPHFPTPQSRLSVSLRQEQDDEETFLLNTTRFRPRLEHDFSSTLSGFVGYRLEFVKLNDIAPATIQALGGIKRGTLLSGPSLGLRWNTTEDPFNPERGGVFSLLVDQAGKLWGGDFHFYKITAEAKKYQSIGWQTVLAGRLKIGVVDAFGSRTNVPLFERYYAGGERSVRGYGRRRLGPLSTSDDPLGGLSLIEGSLELRRPLWGQLSGAVFLDFGQVSRKTFDLPVDDMEFAAGVGASYLTPIGPIRLDIGFPFAPPPGDQFWQLHFSIGQFF